VLRRLRIENLVLIREADLSFGPGLNAITGETGAGKTILAQALGLVLGARGDASLVGPAAGEAYVEAELDLPQSALEDLEALADVRPDAEDGLVAARRVFADGRTRAYAWGRAVAREDLAALVENLVAMSGQFEQRRLARPAFQLDLLDSFAGEEQMRRRIELRRSWREALAARRRHAEVTAAAGVREQELLELRELVARTQGLEAGDEERLQCERERLRHVAELAEAAATAAEALSPESDGSGAAELLAGAEAALAPVEDLAEELAEARRDLADAQLRVRETASSLRGFLASLESEPGRLEAVEEELERITETKRRFRARSCADLVARAESARRELASLDGSGDPADESGRVLRELESSVDRLAESLAAARATAAPALAAAVEEALRGLGVGDGEFRVELEARELGASGRDEVSFLIRPNAGLPFTPVAEAASGGELSRVNLALRAASHAAAGEPTIVFDEIDAGIGGRTAHAVARELRRLADTAQVLTITHLPQIASVADVHFRVDKIPGDPTYTRIERLEEPERREELERMLGGAEFLDLVASAPPE
jgi:DNA repair protein RecN (Recombination protein N)